MLDSDLLLSSRLELLLLLLLLELEWLLEWELEGESLRLTEVTFDFLLADSSEELELLRLGDFGSTFFFN